MSLLADYLKEGARAIRESGVRLEGVGRWIGDYRGKIVGFNDETNHESWHLVFTRERGCELRRGEYASSEIILHGPEQVLLQAVKGELDLGLASKEGKVSIWGNFHEWFPFMGVIKG